MSTSQESGQLGQKVLPSTEVESPSLLSELEDQDGSLIPLVGDVIPSEGRPWAQMEKEPSKWYNIFCRYYITLGTGRSVRAAFRAYCEAEQPHKLNDEGKVPYNATPHYWLSMSHQWGWVERSQAFDRAINKQVLNSVELAFEILKDAAPDAAEALVTGLNNARTRVQAANSILDRIGLPSVHRQESVSVRITAEDVRKAKQEAAEWEKKNFNESG